MATIAGITTEKDTNGNITSVTIDVQQHKEVVTPLLEKLGVIEKTEFRKKFDEGYTIEEARAMSHKHIRELWKK